MSNLVYAFLLIASFKIVINTLRYLQCQRYLRMYFGYLANPEWGIVQHKSHVIKLIQGADIRESYRGVVEPMGWGQLSMVNAPVLENFPNRREDFVGITLSMFHQAIGTYRSRIFETFNPIYWIELVINLPKNLLSYLGVPAESILTKVAQVTWWVAGSVFTFFLALYRTEINQFIKDWIQQLLS